MADWSRLPAASRCLQEREVVPLMQRFLIEGYTVLLETSGERPLERVPTARGQDCGCEVSGFGRGRQLSHGES